jgi:hypothetical protein
MTGKEIQMLKKSLMALALVGAAASVQAATITACSQPVYDFGSGNVVTTVNCGTYVGTYGGNDADPLTVGGVEYDQIAKKNDGENFWTGDQTFSVTGMPGTSGTWSALVNVLYMVIKGGNEYSVYSLGSGGASSGFWATAPNQLNPQGVPQDISHISFYGEGGNEVPVPGTLGLLGLGLVGLGAVRRKQQA